MSVSGLRVMIVDDDDNVCMNLAAFFEDEGCIVHAAATAEEALDISAVENIDAGIIDIRLPGMDGNALILRAHELRPDMNLLIHTGSTGYTLPRELLDIGIDPRQVFIKPLKDMKILVEAIETLIAKKGS